MSSTNELSLKSSIHLLNRSKRPTTITKTLITQHIQTISDLLWIFPHKIKKIPPLGELSSAEKREGELYYGKGRVVRRQIRPLFHRKFKKGSLLYTATLFVEDENNPIHWNLTWFNIYPNLMKQLKEIESVHFWGEISLFNGSWQITNPQLVSTNPPQTFLQYPTMQGLKGNALQDLFERIPHKLWDQVETDFDNDHIIPLSQAFKILHGRKEASQVDIQQARKRVAFEEFSLEQIRFKARKKYLKQDKALVFKQKSQPELPYDLTQDQRTVFQEIQDDLQKGHPMMRLLQGDVGCGKTTIALLASQIVIDHGSQVALMCPTESLAAQHFNTFKSLLPHIRIELLLGGQSAKTKREINQLSQSGEADLVIGTHSLFQKSVTFKKLSLAIIDEQHKFGVKQRLKLLEKGEGVHCLIMTATPIPRSLSLTQFGDLDVSVIKTMPQGRKEIRTRIVKTENYQKFLSFLKTRLSLGEQAYVVVPAIEESEELQDLESAVKKYRSYFPEYEVVYLHGKLSSEEKRKTLENFQKKKGDLIISTSVVEVGIHVDNATVMAILNPERFGLSSLHQLRGRVGRSGNSGFCFLVLEKSISPEALQRIQVLEESNDGFYIAEKDLEIRGEGNLFGTEQAGQNQLRRMANIIEYKEELLEACENIERLIDQNNPLILKQIARAGEDLLVTKTV